MSSRMTLALLFVLTSAAAAGALLSLAYAVSRR
jgi:hypothetical protein